MKNNYYQHNFGHSQAFIRRMMQYLGLHKKAYRRRDDCPAWVKEEAINKAAEKREAKAAKQLEAVQRGAMQMLMTQKKKRKTGKTK